MEEQGHHSIEEIPFPAFLIQDGFVRAVSSAACARLACRTSDLVGKPWSEICSSELPGGVPPFSERDSDGVSSPTEIRGLFRLSDGSVIPLGVSAWPTMFEGRAATAVLARDLTEKDKTEAELRESQEMLRVMFESVAEGVAVIDLEGRFIDMNSVMVRLHGYGRKEELIGRSSLDFVVPGDKERARENMSQTLRSGYSGNLEITLVNKQGREYEAEVSAAPLRDTCGRPIGFIAITRDITERKRAQEALRRAEELNRVLVETADKAGEGLAVFQAGETGPPVCIFVNGEFARIVGRPKEALLGRELPPVIPPEVLARGVGTRFETVLVREGEDEIPVDIGVGNNTYQGKPAVVLYVTDISERKRQEAENLQLQESLRLYSSQVLKASKELLHAIREFHARESMIQTIAGKGLLRRTAGPPPEPVRIDEVELLTPREVQVLQLAARGLSNKDIAETLGITVRTVKGHLINIYSKMKVKSRTEAVSCALKEGWIRLEDIGQGD